MGTHPIFESDFDCLTENTEKKMSNSGKTFEEYRKMLDENPYLQMPAPEEVKHIRDRYAHANKKEACWQIKWDLIHCITDSDCVKVEGNRAIDCFNRRQLPKMCQALLTNLQDCRAAQIDQRSRLRGRRTEGHALSDKHVDNIMDSGFFAGNMPPKL